MESHFIIWYSAIEDLTTEKLQNLIESRNDEEKQRIVNFKFIEDQKRCLLSHLLQHAVVQGELGLESGQYTIERTSENKPYLVECNASNPTSLNFNVSHHGKFVCIASHALRQVRPSLVFTFVTSSIARLE